MKNIKQLYTATASAIIGLAVTVTSCSDPETLAPNLTSSSTKLSSNFLVVNASPDAGSLDLYLNNIKSGNSVSAAARSQSTYGNVSIPLNGVGTGGGAIPNMNIRVKASTDAIGGVLGSSDLIFRAGNNNANNFQAADSAYYTLIVLDSLTRPKPLRTNNALGIGDTTYFNTLTGQYISGVTRAPFSASLKSKTVAIGTVPLGATDPGGVRFLVLTDQLPLPSTTRFPKPAANKAAVRFIHASPNTGSVSVSLGLFNLSTSGTTVHGIFSYPMSFPGFSPSVGSRTATANTYATIDAGAAISVVVKQGSTEIARQDNFTFQGGGVYTIVLSGNRRTLPMPITIIKNK